ncbi:MAG TPA: hypothetical protein VKC35_02620, partial [Vicinamibacterales bacterium]|nr:hypothetical protein [Vicinamibacterales bacterium]
GDEPHRYQLRFHLTPDQRDVAIASVRGGARASTSRLSIVVAGVATPGVEPGWVSFEYGTKHEAPVVTFTADGTASAQFVTLLMPLAHADEPAPDLAVRFEQGVATADVRHGAGANTCDRVRWTLDGGVALLRDDGSRAMAAWSRQVRQ